MIAARWTRALAVVFTAAAAVRLAALIGPVGAAVFSRDPCRPASDYFVEGGEALIHGISFPQVSWDMPGWSVTSALLCRHMPRPWAVRTRGLVLLPCGLLVFGLGWLLHSAFCGGLALLAFSFAAPDWFVERRWLCVCLVTLAAYFVAWRARAPTLRRDWLAAAGLAANHAVISTMFLFGPVLAAWDWFVGLKGAPRRRRVVSAAVLGLAPFIFLGPWLYMNWRIHHRIILFEDGRAESNIVSGALGLVECPGLDSGGASAPDSWRSCSRGGGKTIGRSGSSPSISSASIVSCPSRMSISIRSGRSSWPWPRASYPAVCACLRIVPMRGSRPGWE